MSTYPTPTRGVTDVGLREPTMTRMLDEAYEQSADHMNRVVVLSADVAALSDGAIALLVASVQRKLRVRSEELASSGVADLLERLSALGLSWRAIAALCGVSVPAVRKWRNGESASGENRKRLAHLAAFLEWLEHEQHINDVASWLEMPLVDEAPVSRLDLLIGGRAELVIEGRVGIETAPTELLDRFEPDWRAHYSTSFEVVTADDGHRSIRSTRGGK